MRTSQVTKDFAKFRVQESWVCFDNDGVWVEWGGEVSKEGFDSVQEAMAWVYSYGDRG